MQRFLDESNAPYSLIQSVDPFTGDGLIDCLPKGVSKAYALAWWSQYMDLDTGEIIFAGDSGNDLAAMIAGYRVIVVGNADRSLAHAGATSARTCWVEQPTVFARKKATSGVLEGCRWFGLAGPH